MFRLLLVPLAVVTSSRSRADLTLVTVERKGSNTPLVFLDSIDDGWTPSSQRSKLLIDVRTVPHLLSKSGSKFRGLSQRQSAVEQFLLKAQVHTVPHVDVQVVATGGANEVTSDELCEYLQMAKSIDTTLEVHCMKDQLVQALLDPLFLRLQADAPAQPADLGVNDPVAAKQTQFELLGMREFYQLTDGKTKPVVVAVFDTGITPYDDLENGLLKTPEGALGINTIENNTDVTDRQGHGTLCSSLIAAERDNGIGMVGVSSNARLVAVKGLNDYGGSTVSGLLKSYSAAVDLGADVLSASLGYPTSLSPDIEFFTRKGVEAFADTGGILVVSAGNDPVQAQRLPCIIEHPQLLCVAATAYNALDELAWFSGYGPAVQVAAPGERVESFDVTTKSYRRVSGTSFSTPITAGLVAVLRGMGLSPAETVSTILNTTKPLTSVDGRWITHGRIDPVSAAKAAKHLLESL